MHDELPQGSGSFVAVPSVDHQEPADVFKLRDGEVRRQGRLFPLLQPKETVRQRASEITVVIVLKVQ